MKAFWRLAFAVAVVGAAAEPVNWQKGDGFRYAAVPTLTGNRTGFTLLPSQSTGIAFTNLLSEERSMTNQIYHNGSGVALGDIDGDGLCDIYLGNIDGPNALYRNHGNWKFVEMAATAGVACPELATSGVLFADIDGDGDLDLIVNAVARGTSIFLNDGHGHFTEATNTAGTAARTGSNSAAMADVDGDGDLDLYITNYRTTTLRDEPFTRFKINVQNGKPTLVSVNDRPVSAPELAGRFSVDEKGAVVEHGEADVLFRNEGGGRFMAVAWTNGAFLGQDGRPIAVPYEFGLGVTMRDLNGDGAPDLYVCNDFVDGDRIWMNRGNGTFQLAPPLAFRQTSLFSMGVDVADLDRDGRDDIFVVDMLSREHTRRMVQLGDRTANPSKPGVFEDRPQYMRNTLFWNQGDGTYAEIARFAGLQASEWSWTPLFLDVDLDGFEDLLICNGHLRDGQNIDSVHRIDAKKKERRMSALEQLRLRKDFPKLENRNLAFRNNGHLRFDEMSTAWGFDTLGIKQGMAAADLDNDGDLDLVVNSLNGPALVYRNDSAAPRVAVRLKGKAPNTHGVGAKIRVTGGPVPQSQEMICGGRYLSSDDFVRVFAVGQMTNRLTLEVTWRSGRRSVIQDVRANSIYVVDEVGAEQSVVKQPRGAAAASLFRDVSSTLNHTHHEEEFNDFERQPLLLRKMSQGGPGVSWFDLNGDGFDDLLLSSGKGGTLAAYQNDGAGKFSAFKAPPFDHPSPRDLSAILGFSDGNKRSLLVGASHYEDATTSSASAQTYDLSSGKVLDALPSQPSSTGPLALADINGDGELDLFIGGRVIPGRYPEAASSLLFRGAKGKWLPDAENTKALERIGLVTSAVFSDMDGDGAPDLVVACEWGPLRIFRNTSGHLVPTNLAVKAQSLGLSSAILKEFTGWWNSVATGDFNGDGRMDIVAANWGENAGYHTSVNDPLRIYFGDFNDDGVFDLLEGKFDAGLKKIVPLRDSAVVARALPHLALRFANFEAYGRAGVNEIIDPSPRVRELSINTLQSMVFLNHGTHFEALALPMEAQLSPVFGLGVADFNGDGYQDVLLAQNFFAVDPMTSRYDGGRGLLLLGKGDGTFRSVPASESGIAVYGEGRGLAVCDYDRDGRVDVCIGQNGAQTKLYHNDTGQPGLRVRLKGTPSNPDAIGAVVRAVFSDNRMGAAYEIHAGSGWLSQDSAVPVIGPRAEIRALEVRWLEGKITRVVVPENVGEIKVDLPSP